MMRGDFANLPPGTAHGWTMRSDSAQLALFTMNHRVGAAFVAMGWPERRDDSGQPAARDRRGRAGPCLSGRRFPARACFDPRVRRFGSATSSCRSRPAPTCSPMAAGSASAATLSWRATRTRPASSSSSSPRADRAEASARILCAPLRELLRARRRDTRLGVRQGRPAAHGRLFSGAAAQSARLSPESAIQPVCRLPDAGHLRELLRHDGRAARRRRSRRWTTGRTWRAGGAAAAASRAERPTCSGRCR